MKTIQNLLTILNQLKIYHWGTDSYSKHSALGEAYDKLNDKIDEFVEIFLGKYGKEISPISINLITESEINIDSAIEEIVSFLSNDLSKVLKEDDSDLLNLRDEMLGIVNKTKYLLTLS